MNVDWYFKLHWMDRMLAAQDAGYKVCIISNFSSDNIRLELTEAGVDVYDINLSRTTVNPFQELLTVVKLNKLIEQIDPLLIHGITAKPNAYAGIVAKINDIPIVCSVTGLGVVFSRRNIKNLILKKITMFIYHFVSKNPNSIFLFENSSDRKLLVDHGVIPSIAAKKISGAGVDIEMYYYSLEQAASRPSILFAARLLRDKGLLTLVDAIQIVRDKGMDVELKVAGILDNDAQNSISEEEVVQLEKTGSITWLGKRNDIPQLIRSSSLVCLPTTYGEGIPRVLIESAACGRAIITTNVSGCNEFVIDGFNGLVVEPNNTIELSKAIEKLLLNPGLRNTFGKNGRLLVEKSYTKEIVIDQTLAAYSGVVN